MIEVTRLSGGSFVLNADLIESVEAVPDTGILLVNGRRFVVKESVDEIVMRIAQWKRRYLAGPLTGENAAYRRELAEKSMGGN